MGLFDDKKYESMDEISKMIEPWVNPFDPIIERIPDEYEFPAEYLMSYLNSYDIEPSLIKVVLSASGITPTEINTLNNHQLLQRRHVPGGNFAPGILALEHSPDFYLDAATKEKHGSLKIIKVTKAISEAKLKSIIVETAKRKLLTRCSADSYTAETMRTLYEVATGNPYKPTDRSKRTLICDTREALIKLIEEDRWRIRSFDLYLKLIDWMEDYCRSVCMSSSLANIMKIKIMTHSGKAIYSIGEEV